MNTVGEVAELAGVTVRTLHHYDELGLLSPSDRSEAGYRLYSYDDPARLREILIWRTLGFPLTEIGSLLDDPGHDRLAALERQRELIEGEIERLGALAAAVDVAISAHVNGTRLEDATMFDAVWRLVPGATRIVAHSVTLETEALLSELQQRHGGELMRIDISHAAPLGCYRSWEASRPVVQWHVVKTGEGA